MPRPFAPARILVWFFTASTLAGCSTSNPYYDPNKAHHTAQGFRNTGPLAPGNGGRHFWRWQWERKTQGLPKPPRDGYPVVATIAPDLNHLHHNLGQASATWVNHSTILVQLGGLNILTDPIWSERASPVGFLGPRRRAAPGIAFDDLPRIDAVVISHNHYDHLDAETVDRLHQRYGEALRFYVPLGLKPWFHERGIINVSELDWWDEARLGALRLVLTPAQHWSQRTLWDRNATLWGGWWLEADGRRFFFAGDTGYSDDFKTIRARLGAPDLAAIPVGTYEPRWFMGRQHVAPAEALRIHQDLGAVRSFGIHWGTFELSDEALDQPPRDFAAARAALGVDPDAFFLLRHGETRRFGQSASGAR